MIVDLVQEYVALTLLLAVESVVMKRSVGIWGHWFCQRIQL